MPLSAKLLRQLPRSGGPSRQLAESGQL